MGQNLNPIKVEATLNATVDEVWYAITSVEQMKVWYFNNIPDFKTEVGFKTQFKIGSNERTFTANWEVLKVTENSRIKYSWKYNEYKDGLGTTDWIITEKDGKTLLTLIDEGLESFPQNVPEFTRESCIAGWEYFLNDRLKNYIENQY